LSVDINYFQRATCLRLKSWIN